MRVIDSAAVSPDERKLAQLLEELWAPEGWAAARTVRRGQVLVEAGQRADHLWRIRRGYLGVWAQEEGEEIDERMESGAGTRFMHAWIGPGELYGAEALEGALERGRIVAQCDVELSGIPLAEIAARTEPLPWARSLLRSRGLWTFASALRREGAPAAGVARLLMALEPVALSAAADLAGWQLGAFVLILSSGQLQVGERLAPAGEPVGLEAALMDARLPVRLELVAPGAGHRLAAGKLRELIASDGALLDAMKRLALGERWSGPGGLHPASPTSLPSPEPEELPPGPAWDAPSPGRRWRRYPVVHQRLPTECGAACLSMIAAYHGARIPLREARACARVSAYATSLFDLYRAAQDMGFSASPVEVPWSQLRHAALPAIAHLPERSHFVVLWRVDKRRVVIGDPDAGTLVLSHEEFQRDFRGVLLILQPTPLLGEVGRRLRASARADRPIARLLPFLTPHRSALAQVALASLVLQILGLAAPLGLEFLVDRVLPRVDAPLLYTVFAALAATAAFTGALHWARAHLLFHSAIRLERGLLDTLYRRVLLGSQEVFRFFTGMNLLSRFRDVDGLLSFLADNLVALGVDLLLVITYTAFALAYVPQVAWILLAALPLYGLWTWGVGRRLRVHAYRYWKSFDNYFDHLKLTFDAHDSIRSHALEPQFVSWAARDLMPTLEHGLRMRLWGALGTSATLAFELFLIACLAVLGARGVWEHQLSLGQVLASILLLQSLLVPLRHLSEQWRHLQELRITAERTSELLGLGGGREDGFLTLPRCQGLISFEQVSFRYQADPHDSQRKVLDDINLTIRPGEVVGLVGPSGCGKSTLVRMLLGLVHPERGRVTIDGHNLRDVTAESLRSQVGIVTQEVAIFQDTIYDNITGGRHVTPEAVVRAARAAGAYDFIQELPYGFHTRIGERGLQLSGGQKQRIIIARALVTDPRVLIFDEATAALDPLSEQQIHESLLEIVHSRTTLIVSHRLRTLEHADRIVVMDQGRIVEVGTHAELLERKGLYQALQAASPGWRREGQS